MEVAVETELVVYQNLLIPAELWRVFFASSPFCSFNGIEEISI